MMFSRSALDAQGNPTTVLTSMDDMMKVPEVSKECNADSCTGPAKKWCAQCHAVKYCGRDCQIADWKVGTRQFTQGCLSPCS
jgi:MYND finger